MPAPPPLRIKWSSPYGHNLPGLDCKWTDREISQDKVGLYKAKKNQIVIHLLFCFIRVNHGRYKAKQKYREMFETQKSGNKTSSGEISTCKSESVTGPGVRKSKHPRLACHTCCE